ncbi:MAG: aldehyde dehydrogenase family protein, partial [Fimbriimonadaceae bacterium]
MKFGNFPYPTPVNEPVLNYAPGSAERKRQIEVLKELKGQTVDVPMYIGGQEVRTGELLRLAPPHEHAHTLGHAHRGGAEHVKQAIDAALAARAHWQSLSFENRAAIFLRAAELIATKYRAYMNGTTMLGQSKNVHQAEIDSACEIVDFLRFNVHFLSEIYQQQPISGPGVHNRVEYRPLEGFVLAITPFNFT